MLPSLLILTSYLLGSIPFGYLIVRARGGGDVRETGSGATGATNVTRRAGKWAGIWTLALDALKGAAAVLLARRLAAPDFGVNWWVAACAVAVVAGHCFPVWLRFRGGKGAAAGLGVFLALSPPVVPFALAAFALVVWRTRYVSLGSITAAALVPVVLLLLGRRAAGGDGRVAERVVAAAVGAALVLFMHRANIVRLWQGTESKLKQ
ncbi:MAG: glycerol-3-phosphate 1-O-acyltransferase PlsY [Acidobacteria bacterium]|nr:glycerol-3-phosphate 1-O-acyltransferase PlsY [Acidobacteriota bacterium]